MEVIPKLQEILVAIDGSKHSEKVVDFGIAIAKSSGLPIRLVYVVKKPAKEPEGIKEFELAENYEDAYAEYLQGIGNSVTSKLAERISKASVKYETVVELGNPAVRILDNARIGEAKYIVVGLKGLHGAARLISLGSVARRIIENSSCPVFVVPSQEEA